MSLLKNCLRCPHVLVRDEDKGWKSVTCTVGKSRQVGDIWSRRERVMPPNWCPCLYGQVVEERE